MISIDDQVKVKSVQAICLRAKIDQPVMTSFGVMTDRPAIFVKVEDFSGYVGWGEVWCNFPSCGAEHRVNLVNKILADLVINKEFSNPSQIFMYLTQKTEILAIQSGEYGPFAQCISGIDLAFWDLFSRRGGQPLWKFLGGSNDQVEVYASGINPLSPEAAVEKKRMEGYRSFKLKIGFNSGLDLKNVKNVSSLLNIGESLMLDVNQGWDFGAAVKMLGELSPYDIKWIEEPLRADTSLDIWCRLADLSDIPFAVGENIGGFNDFRLAVNSGAFSYLQPDITKCGGISGNLKVIRLIHERNLIYCPHYLGGGIGLLHSAHFLAANDVAGLLEVDSNDNVLRTSIAKCINNVKDGFVRLGSEPGIGDIPNFGELGPFSSP